MGPDGSGALWLTQARPITTLYPLPTQPDGKLRIYLCLSLAQGLTRPVTPMGIAAFRVLASCASEVVFGSVVSNPVSGPAVFAEAGQRAFVDITPVLHSRVGRTLVPRILDVMEARSAVILRTLCEDPGSRSEPRHGGRFSGACSPSLCASGSRCRSSRRWSGRPRHGGASTRSVGG